jgi:hypothetical protein
MMEATKIVSAGERRFRVFLFVECTEVRVGEGLRLDVKESSPATAAAR